jgi:hypothetical protein
MTDTPRVPPHLPGTRMAVSARPPSAVAVTAAEAVVLAGAAVVGGLGAALLAGLLGSSVAISVICLCAGLAVALAGIAAGSARRRREGEIATLRATADALRATQEAAAQAALKTAARTADQPAPKFSSRRDARATPPQTGDGDGTGGPPEPKAAEAQPSLALGGATDAATPSVAPDDLIRALNFPDGPDDTEGFRALRTALANPVAARAVRSAQDVLTLLAEDGIYMDDLPAERARVELWRRFAQGERGRAVGPIGGVRDRSSLALTAARMRADTIFRDAAHHFIRQFDRMLAEFEPGASDQQLSDLGATRTARAFMLLGRVMAIFD